MKNRKDFLETRGFYLGAMIGSIVYLNLILEMIHLLIWNWDIKLTNIVEMATGCTVGVWFFLFFSAKIGQVIGLLIWKSNK
jgi:hypothetical protein